MGERTTEIWITRRANGTYMLTSKQPIVADGSATKKAEVWPQPGDEFQVLNICPLGALHYFGVKLDPLTPSVLLRMTVGIAGKQAEKDLLRPPPFEPLRIDES